MFILDCMKIYHVFILASIFFLGFTTNEALAQCNAYKKEPTVRVHFNYGNVYYDNSKSSSQFPAMPYSSTMGLTSTQFVHSISVSGFNVPQKNGTICVGIESVTVDIGFPRIDVYIDKKYRPGTCNYNVIKEHENYHVRVQQEGLKFFSPKIKEAFEIAARKINPQMARSKSEASALLQQMSTQIKKDVTPLLNYVEKRLKEENQVIDTKEAYIKDAKRCPKW